MPAYMNDDELFYTLRACRKAEELSARIVSAAQPSPEDLRALRETTASLRCMLEQAEARGKVH